MNAIKMFDNFVTQDSGVIGTNGYNNDAITNQSLIKTQY